jgi:uncharacterized protein DUF5996
MSAPATPGALPDLALEPWEPTRDTLHLWLQVAGKVKLRAAPPRNHWWHVTFSVDTRGLTSRPLHKGGTAFQIDFDFLDHDVVVHAADGREERIALRDGLSVAEFDERLHGALRALGVDVALREEPFGTPVSDIPFPEDRTHAAYDPDAAQRFWRVLLWASLVFEEFAGWSCAKTSPVQVFWHSFDLAVTRFSGARAPAMPGADAVTREAYSHEVVSFGFWPGDPQLRFPAFYSYTAPEPDGLRERPLVPAAASWSELPNGSMALLPYDAVRTAPEPRATLLAFLESAYRAGAGAAGWDREALSSSLCPPPVVLRDEVFGRAG